MKAKFLPGEYQTNLFERLQNSKQKEMIVKEYTKEFYKLMICSRNSEEDMDKIARYMNGLKYSLQEKLILVSPRSLEEAYQFALNAEDKL